MEARWYLVGPSPIVCSRAQALAERIQALAKAQRIKELRIGLEAPGLYWWHLACFLTETSLLPEGDQRIYVFNPALVQGLKRVYADAGKTDRMDAFFIAERLRVGRLPQPFQPDLVYAPMPRLTRFRAHLAREPGPREELLPGLALLAVESPFVKKRRSTICLAQPAWGFWRP
jgi:Transposase